MQPPRDLNSFQRTADFSVVAKGVKSSGIAATLFGVIALFLALLPPMSIALLVLGVVLSFAGIWNLTKPNPIGIVLTGVCLVLVGGYNIVSSILAAGSGSSGFVGWPVLGVWQMVWGFQSFARYRRFANAFANPPADPARRQMDQMLDELRKANPKQHRDVVEFTAKAFTPQHVKVRLMAEGALCLVNAGDDVHVLPRERFDLQLLKDAPFGNVKARANLGGNVYEATMKREHFDRFSEWKSGAVSPLRRAA